MPADGVAAGAAGAAGVEATATAVGEGGRGCGIWGDAVVLQVARMARVELEEGEGMDWAEGEEEAWEVREGPQAERAAQTELGAVGSVVARWGWAGKVVAVGGRVAAVVTRVALAEVASHRAYRVQPPW